MNKLFDYIYKGVICASLITGIVLFELHSTLGNGRYQLATIEYSNRILDTRTGNIYYYTPRDGYYYFEKYNVKHPLKQLPQ